MLILRFDMRIRFGVADMGSVRLRCNMLRLWFNDADKGSVRLINDFDRESVRLFDDTDRGVLDCDVIRRKCG